MSQLALEIFGNTPFETLVTQYESEDIKKLIQFGFEKACKINELGKVNTLVAYSQIRRKETFHLIVSQELVEIMILNKQYSLINLLIKKEMVCNIIQIRYKDARIDDNEMDGHTMNLMMKKVGEELKKKV